MSSKLDCVLPFYIEKTSPIQRCRFFPCCCIYERTTLSRSMFLSPIWCSIPDCPPCSCGDTKICGEHDICECFPFCCTGGNKYCFVSPIFCQNKEDGTTVSCLFCATENCIVSWMGCVCCKDSESSGEIKCCYGKCSCPLYKYRCMISNSGCHRVMMNGDKRILVTPIGCFDVSPSSTPQSQETQSEAPSSISMT